jgi:Tfp pilus assembly protein PilV
MKIKLRKVRKEDGLSLLEVMTAMFIMAFSMILLLHLAMIAVDGNQWASSTTSCTQLMQEKLEELRSSGNPTSGNDTIGIVIRNWTVTNVGAHLRQVDIAASWLTPDSIMQTYNMQTLIKTATP